MLKVIQVYFIDIKVSNDLNSGDYKRQIVHLEIFILFVQLLVNKIV